MAGRRAAGGGRVIAGVGCAEGACEDLPGGAAGGHQVRGEVRVEGGERGQVRVADRVLHGRVEGRGALIQVPGCRHGTAGAAVAHCEQRDARRRARELVPEAQAVVRRGQRGDAVQGTRPGIARLVEQPRADAERQRQPRRGAAGPRAKSAGRRVSGGVQPAARVPAAGLFVRAGHDDHVRAGGGEGPDGGRAGGAQLGQHLGLAGQLAGEQRRARADGGGDDHRGARCPAAVMCSMTGDLTGEPRGTHRRRPSRPAG
jgi:hypothetical protein